MGWSTYLDNAVLNKVLRNEDFTVTVPYVSLHSGDPGDNGANEFAVGTSGYARQAGTFGSATTGTALTTVAALFTNLPAGTIAYAGLWDNGTVGSGNFLMPAALSTSKAVNDGDAFQFNSGDVVASHT